MTVLRVARIVTRVLVAIGVALPALLVAFCLWLEVITGTGTAWGFFQPGSNDPGAAAAWMAFAVVGPAVVVVTMIRSRRRPYGLTKRALHIEKWGLIVGIPLALFSIVVIAAQSII